MRCVFEKLEIRDSVFMNSNKKSFKKIEALVLFFNDGYRMISFLVVDASSSLIFMM